MHTIPQNFIVEARRLLSLAFVAGVLNVPTERDVEELATKLYEQVN